MLEFYYRDKAKQLNYYKCSDCGYVTSADPNRNGCKSCRMKKEALELLNKNNMYFEALDVVYKKQTPNQKYNRRFVIAKCKNCNAVEEIRDDQYPKRKGCKKCGAKIGGKNRILKEVKAAKNRILSSYKANAKNRGYSFEISDKEFFDIISQNCYYCNAKPRLANYLSKSTVKYTEFNFYANGVDRLDNKKGYIKDNVVPCCTACNLMKKELHYKHFLNKITAIYENLIKNK